MNDKLTYTLEEKERLAAVVAHRKNLRRLIVPRSIGLSPDDVHVLLAANHFEFTSTECPFKLREPKSVTLDGLGWFVTFEQWEE
jgi:hypothetical protein